MQIDILQLLMILRIYTLSGDERHNIEYGLENAIKHSAHVSKEQFSLAKCQLLR